MKPRLSWQSILISLEYSAGVIIVADTMASYHVSISSVAGASKGLSTVLISSLLFLSLQRYDTVGAVIIENISCSSSSLYLNTSR
jgi:hypothetical protein